MIALANIPRALGLLFLAKTTLGAFTDDCRHVCLGSDAANFIVTECTVDGGPDDTNYTWSQFDLNKLLGYDGSNIVYKENGNFSISNYPCGWCVISGSVITCDCPAGSSSLDLNQFIDDVVGTLCFANAEFGPICGTPTTRTC